MWVPTSVAAFLIAAYFGVATAEAQPTIRSISVERRGVSLRVRFDTNQDALCVVDYGSTDAYGDAAMQGAIGARRNHSVTLRGLQSSTEYHFRIGCLGEGWRSAYSEDQTATTLTKKVRVTFASLHLNSDSDFWGSGDDMYFTFDINGARVHRWPNDGGVDLSGPCGGWGQGCVDDVIGNLIATDLPQSFVRTVDPEDPSIRVRVYGYDDDGPWNDDAAESFTFEVPLDVESRSRVRTLHANDESLHFHVQVTFDLFHE
jgi:hypothetical protein